VYERAQWQRVTGSFPVYLAKSGVVSDSGEFTAVSWLSFGQTAGQEDAQLLSGGVIGELTNPFTSEIHIDILYHGQPLPLGDGTSIDSLEVQLRYTKGGCHHFLLDGGMKPVPVSRNANDPTAVSCPRIQSAVFAAEEDEASASAAYTWSLSNVAVFAAVMIAFV
jgi:hypothetical protein